MEGSHQQLLASYSRSLRADYTTAQIETLVGVATNQLGEQYIMVEPLENATYQIICGSGMGSKMSGELSDNHFIHGVELEWAKKNEVVTENNVIFYGRYRDDILVIQTGDPSCIVSYIQGL